MGRQLLPRAGAASGRWLQCWLRPQTCTAWPALPVHQPGCKADKAFSTAAAEESPGGASLPIVNPATGERIGRVVEDSADTVLEKFHRAKRGQREWAARPLEDRLGVLQNFGALLQQQAEGLAPLLTAEMGKPLKQSLGEIRGARRRVEYVVQNAGRVLIPVWASPPGANMEERTVYEPLGVVANISAWNYPYFVGMNVVAGALALGNAVLYKPSEHATMSGLAIAELLHEAGVPRDAFVAVTGGGPTGRALSSLPGLGALFFTGSHETGRAVYQAAAGQLTKVHLELGGKDPVYVRADVADVADVAARVADGAFYNCGQSCCAVERVYVHRSIYADFVAAFAGAVRGFRVGDPLDPETYIGPLARRQHLAVLQAQVEDALAKGATALVGGTVADIGSQPGNFFPPTVKVLVDVSHSMAVMREETFGPVVGIQAVDTDEEAVALMADTDYGLTAGVYSEDRGAAEAILAQLDVGTGYWNCCDRSVPQLAWSGRKHSGLGSTLGLDGLRALVRPKAIHRQSP